MTRKEAKAVSLEVWSYLAEHPNINSKYQLPAELFSKIAYCRCHCPLCEVVEDCTMCPLYPGWNCCVFYTNWVSAKGDEYRARAANMIVCIIEAWEPEEE
jgi:hypothetical protein